MLTFMQERFTHQVRFQGAGRPAGSTRGEPGREDSSPSSSSQTMCCSGCGYALTGLESHICPECGRGFDPLDPTTYSFATHERTASPWAHQPSLRHILVCLAATLVFLIGSSQPGGVAAALGMLSAPTIVLGVVLFIVLGIDYSLRLIAVVVQRIRRRETSKRGMMFCVRWLVTPLCIVLMWSASVWSWPLQTRFALDKAAFDENARSLAAVPVTTTSSGRIGSYRVLEIARRSNGCVFYHTGYSGFDRVGFLHNTGSCPVKKSYIDLGDCWYAVWY